MTHYIYQIVHLTTGKYYVGCRTCECKSEDDNYWGSGVAIKQAIAKHGIENFRKEILIDNIPSEELKYELESKIITLEVLSDPNCYNRKAGGRGWTKGMKFSDEHRQKLSEAKRGRPANNPNFGKDVPWNKGKKDPELSKRNRIVNSIETLCPHCQHVGKGPKWSGWHINRCKAAKDK